MHHMCRTVPPPQLNIYYCANYFTAGEQLRERRPVGGGLKLCVAGSTSGSVNASTPVFDSSGQAGGPANVFTPNFNMTAVA